MKFCYLVYNEIKKELCTTLSYRYQWLGELLAVSVYYFYLSHIASREAAFLDSYFVWFFCIVLIGDLSGKIANEMRLGVFEQNYLSVFSFTSLLAAKIVASLIRALAILLVLQVLFFSSNGELVDPKTFMAMFAILPALTGISFFLVGLTILLRDIGWLTNILNNSLLFMSGVLISNHAFPRQIQAMGEYFPTYLAKLMLNQSTSAAFPSALLLLQCLVYPAVGIIVLVITEKRARELGLISGH